MGLGAWGLGLGVWGLGFGVWGLGFGVWGLGVWAWGLGFGVWGLGLGFKMKVLGVSEGLSCVLGLEFRASVRLHELPSLCMLCGHVCQQDLSPGRARGHEEFYSWKLEGNLNPKQENDG